MTSNPKTPRLRREKTTLTSSSESIDKPKEPVHVFCRLRPLKNDEESSCIKLLSPTTLSLTTPAESKSYHTEIHCKFQHIFTAFSDQSEIFQHIAYPLLENLLMGKNGLLFTYGVTGSGKTYTLTGDQKNPGIMPRCIHTIFNTVQDYQAPKYVIKSDRMNGFEIQSESDALQDKMNELRSSRTPRSARKEKPYQNDGTKILNINQSNLYSVFVSYIEIYNNTVFDLLDENTGKTIQGKILREDPQKNMYVNGVVEVEVKSAEEAFEMFNIGQKRKKMGNTLLNSVSSRSHSIFTIRVVQFQQKTKNQYGVDAIPETNYLKVAQLSLVDLAGSERTNRTQNTGRLLKEASQINNSLMSLRNCLEILRDNQINGGNRLVPYRESRLTLLFKNYFEGEGKVSMIVCVNPSVADFDENIQVMKFAEATQDVKVGRPVESRYATPLKKTIQRKTPATTRRLKLTSSFNLGPKLIIPSLSNDNYAESITILDKLIHAIQVKQQKSSELNEELQEKEDHFRRRLVDFNQANLIQNSELISTKTILKKERQRSANLGNKLLDLETANNDLQMKINEMEDIIRSLQNTIAEKDWKINKKILEKEKANQKLALCTEKMTQDFQEKLKKQRMHHQMEKKDLVLRARKAKEILENPLPAEEIEIIPPLHLEKEEKENQPTIDSQPQQTPIRQTSRRIMQTQTPGTASSVRKRRSRSAGPEEIFKGAQMMYEIATFRRPSMFVDPESIPPETETNTDTPTTPAISNFEIDDEFNLPISVAIFILIVYIFLGGLIYCLWEGWDFFDSFYFVFISMSTVGFGDMVPDDAACMIVSIVYLVFGLALTSMCINVVQVKLSDTFKQASTKLGATMGITVNEDDGSIITVPPEAIEIPRVHELKRSGDETPTSDAGIEIVKDKDS